MIQGKLSLVMPAHNEVQNLPAVVARAVEVLTRLAESYQIVIVDDGSQDGTTQLIDKLASDNPSILAVHHPRNLGYGAALTSGFKAATGDYIMFMDADQQFDIGDLTYLAPFIGQYDIVAGYRLHRQDALYRLVYARIFNLAVRPLFGVKVRDVDCAFKVCRADLLHQIELTSPGALINTELLAKAIRSGARIVEVGVNHYPRPSGESSGGSPKVVFRAMKETLALWLRMRLYQPIEGFESLSSTAEGNGKRPRTKIPLLAAIAVIVLLAVIWVVRRGQCE
ncbi:MAG TPA: glycosyltransferase family 2 protein [Thermomicrobiaceae bacterium]|nr:glycosyltransferase family 2 protein [Thermomicrobiaceae bacterium]